MNVSSSSEYALAIYEQIVCRMDPKLHMLSNAHHATLDCQKRSGDEGWLEPAPLAVQASGRVDQAAKDPREEGTNGQLSKQLGQEVGPHFIAPLATLASHNGALLRKGGACLHKRPHGCVDGCYLNTRVALCRL